MTKRVLFVSKDLAGGGAETPVAKQLIDTGAVEVIVVAEGKSPVRWQDAGIKVDYQFSESPTLAAGECNVSKILLSEKPDVVVVGTSSPINLEDKFVAEAKKREIPTVAIEDFHGAHSRLSNQPDLLVVQDDYAEDLAIASGYDGQSGQIVVAGSSAIWDGNLDMNLKLTVESLRSRYGFVTMFSSGSTFDDLKLAVACMLETPGVLIPRLHPKLVNVRLDTGMTYGDRWEQILVPLKERVVWLDQGVVQETDQLSALCDATLSGFSSTLQTAAYHFRRAVSLDTPEVRESLYDQTGLNKVPVVGLGLAHQLSTSWNISHLIPKVPYSLARYQPGFVSEAILGMRKKCLMRL